MRFHEFSSNSPQRITESKVGRELQHLEDLVFIDGSIGVSRALDIVKKLTSDVSDVTVKWDGTPAIVFGRNENGEFVLTDNAGFSAKTYNGRVTSSDALKNMILSRGKEVTDERSTYAQSMKAVWKFFESATPSDFRGYMFGDLMYKVTPAIEDGHYVFKPNKVKYAVKQFSDLGKQIASSKVGVVIHKYETITGSEARPPISQLKLGDVLVLPTMTVSNPSKIDKATLSSVEKILNAKGAEIDNFLEDRAGLKDLKNLIYTYVNYKVRSRATQTIGDDFVDWLGTSGKVSSQKQERIKELNKEFPAAIPSIFTLVKLLMQLKNQVIKQFDNDETDIKSSIDGEAGGEGYVVSSSSVKLVPRDRFIPGVQ